MERSMTVHRTIDAGLRTFYEGEWAGQEVVLVLSRVGKVSAAVTTMLLLERFGVSHIIFTGVAGGIDPRLRIGDVVIADRLIQHDMDASPLPAFQRFEIPLLGKTYFEVEEPFFRRAHRSAEDYVARHFAADVDEVRRSSFGISSPSVYTGLIASGDQFLADPAVTKKLAEDLPGLLCAEMEGAAVAQVCHEMGSVPNAVIRVISDQADHGAAIDFLRFIDEVAEYLTGGIVRTLLESYADKSSG